MRYLVLAAMLLTFNAFGQTASKIPSFTIGGRVITSLTNLIVINTVTGSGATSLGTGGVAYDVPDTKTFRIIGVRCHVSGATPDTAAIGWHTATLSNAAPTGTPLTGSSAVGSNFNMVIPCHANEPNMDGGGLYFGENGPTITGTAGAEIPWADGLSGTNNPAIFVYGYEE